MTKQELLGALTNIWQNFVIGLIAIEFMPEEKWVYLSQGRIRFDGPDGPWLHIGSDWAADVLGNSQKRILAIGEFEKSLKRVLMRESHELLMFYCEETGQFSKYKLVSWFQFSRLIRNIVSHKQGGKLNKWPKDLERQGVTNVSWRNRTLSIEMVGQDIQFTHQEALQLFADQFDFVREQLS